MTIAELSAALEERARPEGLAWLREASAAVAADATAIRSRFPMVERKVGREPLDADADPQDVHAWTIDDAASAQKMYDAGVAAVITNDPPLVQKALAERDKLSDQELMLVRFRKLFGL